MNRKKILVVDDNPVIIATFTMKLNSCGYQVVTATDGSEAVSAARKEKPDLILLDISFPPDVAHGGGVPWDGFRIIEWLRRVDESKNIPIIVITGSDPAKYQERALATGAIGFFQKPVDTEELLSVIKKTLNDGDSPPANEAVCSTTSTANYTAEVQSEPAPRARGSIFGKLTAMLSSQKRD